MWGIVSRYPKAKLLQARNLICGLQDKASRPRNLVRTQLTR